jgi:hypothetical protein
MSLVRSVAVARRNASEYCRPQSLEARAVYKEDVRIAQLASNMATAYWSRPVP